MHGWHCGQPPALEPISLASACGRQLVIATRSSLHSLCINPPTASADPGKLQLRSTTALTASPSALALLLLNPPITHPSRKSHAHEGSKSQQQQQQQQQPQQQQQQQGAGVVAGGLSFVGGSAVHIVAVGEWMTNRLRVYALQGMREVAVLDLGAETPRSAAVLLLPGGRQVLLVGTNGGQVIMYQILFRRQSPTATAGHPTLDPILSFGPGSTVCVSSVAVTLQPVHPDLDAHSATRPPLSCYAHAGSGAIIRGRRQRIATPAPSAGQLGDDGGVDGWSIESEVEVVRVHGAESLRGFCGVAGRACPRGSRGSLATPGCSLGGCRRSGSCAGLPRDTVQHIARHRASGCHVLLTEDREGQCWLRLVHAQSLMQVLAIRLASGHTYTSLLVAALPCSSQPRLPAATAAPTHAPPHHGHPPAAHPRPTPASPGRKEFVVVGSLLQYDAALLGPPHTQPSQQAQPGGAGRRVDLRGLLTARRPAAAAAAAGATAGGAGVAAAAAAATTPGGSGSMPAGPGLERALGLLSFFEVAVRPVVQQSQSRVGNGASTGGGSGSGSGSSSTTAKSYSLLLHGSSPCAVVPLCLGVATPRATDLGSRKGGEGGRERGGVNVAVAGEGKGRRSGMAPPPLTAAATPEGPPDQAHPNSLGGTSHHDPASDPSSTPDARSAAWDAMLQPHLLVGGHDGVHVYSVHVDDERRDGERAMSAALRVVRCVPPAKLRRHVRPDLPEHLSESDTTRAAAAAAGRGLEGSRGGSRRDPELAEDESQLPDVSSGDDSDGSEHIPGDGSSARGGAQGLNPSDPNRASAGSAAVGSGAMAAGSDAVMRDVPTSDDGADGGGGDGEGEGEEMESGDDEDLAVARDWLGYLPAGSDRDAHREDPDLNHLTPHMVQTAGSGVGRRCQARGEDLRGRGLLVGGCDGGSGRGVAPMSGADSAGELAMFMQRDWSQRVTVFQVSQAPTRGGACATSLSKAAALDSPGGHSSSTHPEQDSTILASDLLGSVTVLQLLCNRTGVVLLPVSADHQPVWAQASLLLPVSDPRSNPESDPPLRPGSGSAVAGSSADCSMGEVEGAVRSVSERVQQVLVALHPHGLAVLERRLGSEDAYKEHLAAEVVKRMEGGTERAPHDSSWHAMQPTALPRPSQDSLRWMAASAPPPEFLPELRPTASCRLRHGITKFIPGRLGLASTPLPRHPSDHRHRLHSAATGSGHGSSSGSGDRIQGRPPGSDPSTSHADIDVLCLTSSGLVARVRGLDHTTASLVRGLQAVLEQLTPSQLSRLGPLPPGGAQRLTVSDSSDATPSNSAPPVSGGVAAAGDRSGSGSGSGGNRAAAGKDTGPGGGCTGAEDVASDVDGHGRTAVSASASVLTDADPSSTLEGHASSWALRLPPRDFVPTGDGEEGTGEEEAEGVYESGGWGGGGRGVCEVAAQDVQPGCCSDGGAGVRPGL
ncbi:MAG: hypothetical protein WDW38_009998 [Sanguina aurantia]